MVLLLNAEKRTSRREPIDRESSYLGGVVGECREVRVSVQMAWWWGESNRVPADSLGRHFMETGFNIGRCNSLACAKLNCCPTSAAISITLKIVITLICVNQLLMNMQAS